MVNLSDREEPSELIGHTSEEKLFLKGTTVANDTLEMMQKVSAISARFRVSLT